MIIGESYASFAFLSCYNPIDDAASSSRDDGMAALVQRGEVHFRFRFPFTAHNPTESIPTAPSYLHVPRCQTLKEFSG